MTVEIFKEVLLDLRIHSLIPIIFVVIYVICQKMAFSQALIAFLSFLHAISTQVDPCNMPT